MPWRETVANEDGDWINQRSDEFESLMPLGSKDKAHERQLRVFDTYSRGLETGRDAWAYSESATLLTFNVGRMISKYNAELARWAQAGSPAEIASFVDSDPTAISWTRSLRQALVKRTEIAPDSEASRPAMYRPFNRREVYFAKFLNHERSQLSAMFPTPRHDNFGFYYVGIGSAVPFSILMLDVIPDLHITGAGSGGQFFPRYSYAKRVADENQLGGFDGEDADDYIRVDNVTDGILADYQATYGAEVTKDDIFFYVYGLLHSPDYRERFAADLKKMLPRIPKVRPSTLRQAQGIASSGSGAGSGSGFWAFAEAGRNLSALHLGYETIEPWPLEEVWATGASTGSANGNGPATGNGPANEELFHVKKKMSYGGKRPKLDKSRVVVNAHLELRGIPEEAHEYMLGSRSALDWILERYQIKVDKPSGIVNDPNDWGKEHGDPRYIVDLVKRITRVSVETVAIVKSLPPLDILVEGEPAETTEPTPDKPGVQFR